MTILPPQTSYDLDALESRVDMLSARMTLREPFIASVYTAMTRKYGVDGTASTDGKNLYFGASFCEPLTDDELMFVCLHEALHAVFMHMFRLDERNPRLWNIACDAVINYMLRVKGYTMPAGGVLLDWVDDSHDAESVYRKLCDEDDGDGGGDGGGGGGGDGDGDGDGDSGSTDPSGGSMPSAETGGGGWDGHGDMAPAPNAADELDVKATILTAARMAKAAGDQTALIDRLLEGELDPVVTWDDVLRPVMTSIAHDDYSYARPERKYAAYNLMLPSLHSEGLGWLVVGFDTSGSMSDELCKQTAVEINAIVEDCDPDGVIVVYCDTHVQHVERFERGETVELHPRGGGGTRVKPVFDHIDDELADERIAALVYFTDLYTPDLDELHAPEYPVIWAVHSNSHATVPFGDITDVVFN